ncbi:MAG TPA: tetratricopeptide repeat protein, partial [bacterium]|nr:tetratricopeptide repeat protein [bacterium]
MWEFLEELPSSGMSRVFRARSPEGMEVAVKVVPPDLREEIASLKEEVRFLSRLRHPNLVPLLGFSERSAEVFGEDRGPCYWMEYVEGSEILVAARGRDPSVVFEWFRGCLDALKYIHSQNVLHGDLSPRNILVDREGKPRLLDFGLSSLLSQSSSFNPRRIPLPAATLPYVAPERLGGVQRPAGDLFSLGTIFYEALAGVHPRAGCRDYRDLLRAAPKPLLETAPGLGSRWALWARVIDRMVERDLVRRFAGVDEVAEALGDGKIPFAPRKAYEYHAAVMIEAEPHFEKLGEVLSRPGPSAVFCVHGVAGVGKKRFLKEAATECLLRNVPCRVFYGPEEAMRFFAGEKRPDGIVFLEWNDDELNERFKRPLGRLLKGDGVSEIHLQNLSPEGTRAFLAPLGPRFEEIRGDIFEITGGNPLLLVESVGLLQESGSTAGLKNTLSSLKKDSSLQALVALRLRSLGPSELRILAVLAAARYPVTSRSLQEVLGEAREVFSLLPSLVERGLVIVQGAAYRLAFSFLEPTVLQRLSDEEKEKVHERWLQTLRGTPYPHPQRLRHALALWDENEVFEGARRTAESLREKGRKDEALEIANEALAIMKDRDETSRLLRLKTNLLNELGRFEAALETADEWFGLDAADEPAALRAVKYWFVTGSNLRALGRLEESSERLKRSLQEGARRPDLSQRPFPARAWNLLGMNALDGGRLGEAGDCFQKALGLAESRGRERAEICRNLAASFAREGDWGEARRHLAQARRLYGEEDFHEGLFATLSQEGFLRLERGDEVGAEAAFEEAEKIARERRNDLLLASVWTNLGLIDRRRGRLAQALERLTRAREILEILGNPNDLAETSRQLGLSEAEAGRFDRAEGAARDLRDLAPHFPDAAAFACEVLQRVEALRNGGPETDSASPDLLRETYEALPPAQQVTIVDR